MKRLRPRSILLFERLLLFNAAFSAVTILANYDTLRADSIAHGGAAAAILIYLVAGLGFNLLFWYLITRRAQNWAKWVLVVISGYFIASSAYGMASEPLDGLSNSYLAGVVLSWFLKFAVLACLFRRDARGWLESGGRDGPVDPNVFD